ncbi:MAG: seg [Microgenomates group bacterium GW2011_GWC1_39_12]|nr:MAG: seg [Microgenomates group bacterium GW2011_GWC1_39_12]
MKKGFSLIELIVVIAITAVLLAVALPNLLSARERARDAKRKQEAQEMKSALRLYYTDHQAYPPGGSGGMGKLNYISGCGTDAVSLCPCVSGTTTVDFAAGTACENIYMKRFPSEFGSNTINYHQGVTGSDDFCIDALLENAGDPDTYDNLTAKGKTPCVSACGSYCSGTKYCLCSD